MEVESVSIGMETDSEMVIDYGMGEDQEEATMKPIEVEEELLLAIDNNMDEEMGGAEEDEIIINEEILPEADMKDVSNILFGGVRVELETEMTNGEIILEEIFTSSTITKAEDTIINPPLPEIILPLPVQPIPSTLPAESTPFVPVTATETTPLLEVSKETTESEATNTQSLLDVLNLEKEAEAKVQDQIEESAEAAVETLESSSEVKVLDSVVKREAVEREEAGVEVVEPLASIEEEVSETVVGDDEEPSNNITLEVDLETLPTSDIAFGNVGCTCSSSIVSRPVLDKYILASIDTSEALGAASSEDLIAPTVLLTYNNNTYSLFQRYEGVGGGGEEENIASELDETLPVLFTDKYDNTLYYDTIETLIDVLRDTLSDLRSKEDELVLSFNAIGITLNEDSIYTREVSLADFDKIHIGCGLPGRLHLTLEFTPRFSSGFNALAHHVSNLARITNDADKTFIQEEETTFTQNKDNQESSDNSESVAIINAAGGVGTDESYEFVENDDEIDNENEGGDEEGEYEDSGEGDVSVYEDEEWHSEVFESEEAKEEQEIEGRFEQEGEVGSSEVENGEVEQKDFYDDEALADIDSDDLVALIEGAEEDFVESELLLEEEEESKDEEGAAGSNENNEVKEEVVLTIDTETENSTAKDTGLVPAEVEIVLSEVESTITVESGSDLTSSVIIDRTEEVRVAELLAVEESPEDLENDVVIDYEEVVPSTLPSPQVLPTPTPVSLDIIPPLAIPSTAPSIDYDSKILSFKRSHSSLKDDEVDDGELKRSRLAEPTSSA